MNNKEKFELSSSIERNFLRYDLYDYTVIPQGFPLKLLFLYQRDLKNLYEISEHLSMPSFLVIYLHHAYYDRFYYLGLKLGFQLREEGKENLPVAGLPSKFLREKSAYSGNMEIYKNFLLEEFLNKRSVFLLDQQERALPKGGTEKDQDTRSKFSENLYYRNPIAHFNLFFCQNLYELAPEDKIAFMF
jgi:hypothetical protein